MSTTDKIEREITIAAPLARVWDLVAEPGWWIGDDDRSAWRRWREGDLDIVEDPRIGRFPVRTVALEPQHHTSFRWAFAYLGETPNGENSSLVEFWLSEHTGGTLVRVVESGFDALSAAAAKRDRTIDVDGNVEGWRIELDFLKANAERIAS